MKLSEEQRREMDEREEKRRAELIKLRSRLLYQMRELDQSIDALVDIGYGHNYAATNSLEIAFNAIRKSRNELDQLLHPAGGDND